MKDRAAIIAFAFFLLAVFLAVIWDQYQAYAP